MILICFSFDFALLQVTSSRNLVCVAFVSDVTLWVRLLSAGDNFFGKVFRTSELLLTEKLSFSGFVSRTLPQSPKKSCRLQEKMLSTKCISKSNYLDTISNQTHIKTRFCGFMPSLLYTENMSLRNKNLLTHGDWLFISPSRPLSVVPKCFR